jgi:hypothetical protein
MRDRTVLTLDEKAILENLTRTRRNLDRPQIVHT